MHGGASPGRGPGQEAVPESGVREAADVGIIWLRDTVEDGASAGPPRHDAASCPHIPHGPTIRRTSESAASGSRAPCR